MASADPQSALRVTPVLAQLMGWLCYRLDNEVWKSCQAQTGSARQSAPAFRPFRNLFNGSSSPLLNWSFNTLCGRSKKGFKSAKRGREKPNFLNCLPCKDFIFHQSLSPCRTTAPPVSQSTLPKCSKSRGNRLPTKASAAGLKPIPGESGLAGVGPDLQTWTHSTEARRVKASGLVGCISPGFAWIWWILSPTAFMWVKRNPSLLSDSHPVIFTDLQLAWLLLGVCLRPEAATSWTQLLLQFLHAKKLNKQICGHVSVFYISTNCVS